MDRRKDIKEQWKGKSLWVGKCGEEVNVETLALQHYELQGFKGLVRIIGISYDTC